MVSTILWPLSFHGFFNGHPELSNFLRKICARWDQKRTLFFSVHLEIYIVKNALKLGTQESYTIIICNYTLSWKSNFPHVYTMIWTDSAYPNYFKKVINYSAAKKKMFLSACTMIDELMKLTFFFCFIFDKTRAVVC